ncbi:MAG: hypothetical protein J2O44_00535 [Porphyrobacter sp.]|nr:hypothetical protein [Porphyrobacter sp.]
MNSLAAIVAALALVVPAPPASFSGHPESGAFDTFRHGYRSEAQHQVRIEQHVIIRITPGSPSMREQMFAPPRDERPVHYREKKADRCVPIEAIAGIAPAESNRLLLFMRDHQMLSAELERACNAEAFYLGAYVERSADGKLCAGRDMLHSRTGATCQISRLNRLVAVKD